MQVTGTHINYYFICHRKLWLFANSINMESTSDLVYEGRMIHETSYPQRPARFEEIEIAGIKIDFFDAKNKIIHEIKKSDKKDDAHTWQVKYYIFILERYGVNDVSGLLEYPKMRETRKVMLNDSDREKIRHIEKKIKEIIRSAKCPVKPEQKHCKHCSYFDFCWSSEE